MSDDNESDATKERPLNKRNPHDPDLFVQNYNKLPEMSFATLNTNPCVAILIKRGEDGYSLVNGGKPFPDEAAARAFVKEQNEKLGVTPRQALAMKHGSMFGFDTKSANPDEDCNDHEEIL